MNLKIYNTLTGKKEIFVPINKDYIGMYVCGPTVYDASHIGHARSAVVFDVIYRWFMHLGYDVRYVRNLTDVDDKIIKKANETNQKCSVLTEKYTKEFHAEMDALNVLRPDIEPKATKHIKHMIDFIGLLIDKGSAYYVKGGDVYFSIDSFDDYGKLSNRKPEEMIAGSRVEVAKQKRNPLDFTLWKPAKENEPFWESPWGKGRPGWHIECSAMSCEYLGKGFDIHGGGKDLIFPHHENEIAQSQAAFENQFASYWIHNGFVNINDEKMSKSLGNFTMIKDVLKLYHPEVIRMFLLSKHYRNPIDFTQSSMQEIQHGMDRIYAFMQRVKEAGLVEDKLHKKGELYDRFAIAMNDDFNCAKAIGFIFDSIRKGNKLLDKTFYEGKDINFINFVYNDIKTASKTLGIFLLEPETYFKTKEKKQILNESIDRLKIEELIQQRADARKNKDFAKADEIRDDLYSKGIILEDSHKGTTWQSLS